MCAEDAGKPAVHSMCSASGTCGHSPPTCSPHLNSLCKVKVRWCLSLQPPPPRSRGSSPQDHRWGRVFCLTESPTPAWAEMLAPEFLQIWSCPDSRTCFLSPAPAAAPPCWPPEGPPLMGGPPQSPQKPPKEEILFLPLQAGNYRMFLLEFFGFHTAECSSLISHRFPFPVGQQFFGQRCAWTLPPLSPPPSPMFVASQTKYAKEPRRTDRK